MATCGAAASFQRPGATGRCEYFCDVHQQPGDESIAFAAPVPRVSVLVEFVLCGTSWHPAHAKSEAIARLRQATERVGAAASLHSVVLTTGRYMRPVPERAANASEGEG